MRELYFMRATATGKERRGGVDVVVCSEREEAGLRQFERATSPQTSSPRQRSPTAKPLALQIGSNKFAGGQSLASTGSTRAQDGSVGRGVARRDGSDVRGAYANANSAALRSFAAPRAGHV